jgi:hypothetical protein
MLRKSERGNGKRSLGDCAGMFDEHSRCGCADYPKNYFVFFSMNARINFVAGSPSLTIFNAIVA